MKSPIRLLGICVLLFCCTGQAADSLSARSEAMQRLDEQILAAQGKAALLEQALHALLAAVEPRKPAQLSDSEARTVYDAARLAAFYGNTPYAARALRAAWEELARRQLAPQASADEVAANLVAARLFDEAQTYAAARRSLLTGSLPRLEDLPGAPVHPTLLEISADGSVLHRREFDRIAETVVLVIGAPGCSFSRKATQAMENDAQLSALMARHAVWLMPQQVVRDFAALARWNQEHPIARLGLIYRDDEWKFLGDPATPSFFFFRQGRLVESFSGWPGDGQKARLLQALGKLEIAPSSSENR